MLNTNSSSTSQGLNAYEWYANKVERENTEFRLALSIAGYTGDDLPKKPKETTPALEAAISYAVAPERGWKVFPANLETPKVKKAYLAQKYVGTPWGMTDDTNALRVNFTNNKWRLKCGIGVPTGAVNGIFVVEADTKKGHGVDGLASLKKLEAKHGKLPDTLMSESPSRSVHYYFKHPGRGFKVKNSAGKIASGVDVRGDGGMVVAPPSKRADGEYRWLNNHEIADAPSWLLALVTEEATPDPAPAPANAYEQYADQATSGREQAYAKKALSNVAGELSEAPIGQRNHKLNLCAFRIGRMIARDWIGRAEVEAELEAAAALCGLDEGVSATIRSGINAGLKKPIEPLPEEKTTKQEEKPVLLKTLFLEELQQRPLVPVEWIVQDYVLAGTINGLFGDGGTGKDLLLFQLAIAMTSDAQWLGRDVKQGRVIYCMVEDSLDELRRREDKITTYLATHGRWRPRAGELMIMSLVGEDSVLASFDQKSGVVQPRPFYTALCEIVEEFKPNLVIVPNRVNGFSVDQMNDAQARQCLALLARICERSGTAVIMPGHVSLGQISSGDGSSGSVQWSNGMRLRSFLRRPKPDKDQSKDDVDPNLRELEVMKANWSPTGMLQYLMWEDGLFKPCHLSQAKPKEVSPDVQRVDDDAVLKLIKALVPGDHVSPKSTAPNNVVTKLSERGGHFKLFGRREARARVESAVKRLYENGSLHTVEEGPPSRRTYRIEVVKRRTDAQGFVQDQEPRK